jgi:hypothetical protein
MNTKILNDNQPSVSRKALNGARRHGLKSERNDKKNFLFIVGSKPATSEHFHNKLISLNNSAMEKFFSRENINALMTVLCGTECSMAKYNKVKANDYVPDFTIDTDNPCYLQPKLASQLVEHPSETEMRDHIKQFLPSPYMQVKIINTRDMGLIRTLVWWSKRIVKVWSKAYDKDERDLLGCEGLFGDKNGLFTPELLEFM